MELHFDARCAEFPCVFEGLVTEEVEFADLEGRKQHSLASERCYRARSFEKGRTHVDEAGRKSLGVGYCHPCGGFDGCDLVCSPFLFQKRGPASDVVVSGP